MESRKIQKSVSGSFLVTIPKKWIEREGLDDGNTVNLFDEEDGSIRFVNPKNATKGSVECSFAIEDMQNSNALRRKIEACYVSGNDVITIASRKTMSPEWKKTIRTSLMYLIGTEISEEHHNRVQIKTIVDPTRFPIKDVFKRLFIVVNGMYSESLKGFWNGDLEIAEDVIGRKEEVEKLYRLMLRQLIISSRSSTSAKSFGMKGTDEMIMFAVAGRDLWRVGFYSRDIAKQVIDLAPVSDDKIKEDMAEIHSASMRMLEDAMASFLMSDFTQADKVIEKMDWVREIDAEINKRVLKSCKDVPTALALTTISRNMRRIASYAAAIADGTQWKCCMRPIG